MRPGTDEYFSEFDELRTSMKIVGDPTPQQIAVMRRMLLEMRQQESGMRLMPDRLMAQSVEPGDYEECYE